MTTAAALPESALATAPPRRHAALRVVLVGLGAISAFVAINVAGGGLKTLGLQGSTRYFQITDHDTYLLRDSHTRFYGGVYLGIAAFLVLAATDLRRYRSALNVVFGLIFVGGLARLTQLEPSVTFGKDLAVSTAIELVGMPALALWIARATRPETSAVEHSTVLPIA